MNLSKTIRRDGTVVHYLNCPEEVEASPTAMKNFLSYLVGITNRFAKLFKLK